MPVGYPQPYYAAFAEMEKKPSYWGLAPIHHGCFENGWRGALVAAAVMADETDPILAARIRELGVYTNENGVTE